MPVPNVEPRELLALYQAGDFPRLSEQLLATLRLYRDESFLRLALEDQHRLNVFVSTFLFLFTQPDYVLADAHIPEFLGFHPLISNLIAMSALKSADPFLRILEQQSRNFVKYLTLCSCRNTLGLDRDMLFQTSPELASMWYSYYTHLYPSANVNEKALENLREHLLYDNPKIVEYYGFQEPYFGSTYVDPQIDRTVRERINRWVQRSGLCTQTKIDNRPNPRSIAVLTAFWQPVHSSYRILSQFVDALAEDYELTLINLGPPEAAPTAHFRQVHRIELDERGLPQLQPILSNDFMVALYLDVGMSPLSIVLTNLRLAPIQICGLGQSVSTFGSRIDYFLSGAEVELLSAVEENYSERLVLLPGAGAIHNRPEYEPHGRPKPQDRFIVNCSWYSQKITPPMIGLLHRVIDRLQSGKRVVFRFYPGHSLGRQNDFIPFVQDLDQQMGAYAEIAPAAPYPEYMALMEEGEICIDCFPFGGCNTVADSLFLRKPTITYEGTRWYNRIGSQMLRSVGLEELVAHNDDEYVHLVTRLIDDDDYRADVQRRLDAVDLDATIFNTTAQADFRQAVKYLIDHHAELAAQESRTPIVIGE